MQFLFASGQVSVFGDIIILFFCILPFTVDAEGGNFV